MKGIHSPIRFSCLISLKKIYCLAAFTSDGGLLLNCFVSIAGSGSAPTKLLPNVLYTMLQSTVPRVDPQSTVLFDCIV